MTSPTVAELVVGLSAPSRRAQALSGLAARLGVEATLLFARDPQRGVLLPAEGLQQPQDAGPSWRSFLSACGTRERHTGTVELPRGCTCPALALVDHDAAMILIGQPPPAHNLHDLERMLPLLGALLRAEKQAALAVDEADAAPVGQVHELARALAAARAEASELKAKFHQQQQRKDEFLAVLGHELRNPLAPLITAVELLGTDKYNQVPRDLVKVLARQTARLTRLVNDLLDVARVSHGRIELQRERLSLAEILQHAHDDCQPLFEKKELRVSMEGTDQSLRLDADPLRLIQIFGNLFNNAAKFSRPGGQVAVRVTREGDFAVVCVTDTGIGIAPQVLPHIFDLFTQASSCLEDSEGGLGIGLTVTRALVELHGGRITAHSAGVDAGASFTVRLPLAVTVDPRAMPERTGAGDTPTDTALRVLIVDDNRDAADSIALLLDLMGHTTQVAYDGPGALELACAYRADLIILDIGLPGMSGYDVARKLRPTVKPGARLVALTGYGTEESRRRSREAGFDAHYVKPITSETLEYLLSTVSCAETSSTPPAHR